MSDTLVQIEQLTRRVEASETAMRADWAKRESKILDEVSAAMQALRAEHAAAVSALKAEQEQTRALRQTVAELKAQVSAAQRNAAESAKQAERTVLQGAEALVEPAKAELCVVKDRLATLAGSMNKFISQFEVEVGSGNFRKDGMIVANTGSEVRWGGVAANHWSHLYSPWKQTWNSTEVDHSHEGRIFLRFVSKQSRLHGTPPGFPDRPYTDIDWLGAEGRQKAQAHDAARQQAATQYVQAAIDEKARFLSQLCHETK